MRKIAKIGRYRTIKNKNAKRKEIQEKINQLEQRMKEANCKDQARILREANKLKAKLMSI